MKSTTQRIIDLEKTVAVTNGKLNLLIALNILTLMLATILSGVL